MPLDTHARIAAWLHIVLGALGVCVIGLMSLALTFFGGVIGATALGPAAGVPGWIAGLGFATLLFLLVFPLMEIVGGVLLLGGSAAGRVLTLVFSVLGLLNFPIGTAIGAYSLWALLRQQPQAAAPGSVVVEPGARPY